MNWTNAKLICIPRGGHTRTM